MSDPHRYHHISSAVVSVLPAKEGGVVDAISVMPGVEIYARNGGRIVVVLEGSSTGELGDRLTAINQLDGVIAASMVFEHIDKVEVAEP